MLVTLFILVSIQSLASSEIDYGVYRDQCEDIMRANHQERQFTDRVPGAEEISYRCPSLKDFLDCRIKHYYEEFESRHSLEDYRGIKSLVDDMCDEDSELRKAYLDNLECYRNMVDEFGVCHGVATGVFSEYHESSYAVQIPDLEESDEEEEHDQDKEFHAFYEPFCLTSTYAAACMGTKILDTCGSDGYEAYITIMKRGRIVNDFCPKEAKSLYPQGFVDFLENGKDPETDVVRLLFDIETE